MALPDYFKIEPGTAIIWGQPSASGVTNNLTLDALADGTAREGVYADLGATFDEEYSVQLIVETGTAPAAGARVDLYLVCADATTRAPGGLSGTDAAWPSDSSEDEWCAQLGQPTVTLIATADANTVQRTPAVIWRPSARYVYVVVDNNLGQAFRDETTATDNDSRVVLVPRRLLVQDSA